MQNVAPLIRDGSQNIEAVDRIAGGVAPTISTASLPAGIVGGPYSFQLVATGSSPRTWSRTSGTMPAGLSLSASGLISGTPTAVSTASVTFKVDNMAGSASKVLAFSISLASAPPVITTTSLPVGIVGTPYSAQLAATGQGTIGWEHVEGMLPEGFGLASSGRVSGTPGEPGKWDFTAAATNSAGTTTKALSVVVANSGSGGQAPLVTTVVLDPAYGAGNVNGAFSLDVRVDDQDGEPIANIGGSAMSTADGVASVSILGVTDASGHAVLRAGLLAAGETKISATFDTVKSGDSVVVASMLGEPPSITTTTLPSGKVGVAYSVQLTATGAQPITWSVLSGALPSGIALSNAGLLSGVPTAVGTVSVTVRAVNNAGSQNKTFSIAVSAGPVVKKLLITGLDSDSYGDTNVSGVVFAMPAPGRLVGAPIGEFAGKTIDNTGSLKVNAAEFGGDSLAVGTKVRVYMESPEEFSPLFEAEVIEE